MDVMTEVSTDRLESTLTAAEEGIALLRAIQLQVLTELDHRQVAGADGARSMQEWVAARLDVTAETAAGLTQTAQRLEDHPALAKELAEGRASFDRVAEEARLVAAGASVELVVTTLT